MDERDPLEAAVTAARRYLHSRSTRLVRPELPGSEVGTRLPVRLPDDGLDPAGAIDLLASIVDASHLATGSPRYFGWVVGGTLPVALAADWLVSTWDGVGGVSAAGPALARIEQQAGEWARDLLGLPPGASFGFTTGCQTAHVVALAAARHSLLEAREWDVERAGLFGAPRIRVLAAEDRHVTVDVALRYLGVGTDAVTPVPADPAGRMHIGELERLLREHRDDPTIVIAQAGNIHTGAFDDFSAVCALAHETGAWVHVDGAFGLWARATGRLRHLTTGVESADSWATDAHKVLNTPYDCGIVLCAHPAAHRAAMAGTGSYVTFDQAERDPNAWVLEYSRRARAVPVWAALATLGRRGVDALVCGLHDRARQFGELLANQPGVAVLNDIEFNRLLVRFADDDAATAAAVAATQRDGTLWLGTSRWHGMTVGMISVCNHETTEADITRSVSALLAAAATPADD